MTTAVISEAEAEKAAPAALSPISGPQSTRQTSAASIPIPCPKEDGSLEGRTITVHITDQGGVTTSVVSAPVSVEDLVSGRHATPSTATASVTLHTFLQYGRVFSAYEASLSALPTTPTSVSPSSSDSLEKVVVKVHRPAVSSSYRTEEVAWEAWLYAHRFSEGPISDLVPKFHGVFQGMAGGERLVTAVLEHVGAEMGPNQLRELSVQEREMIMDKYRRLHAAGIVHRSCKSKHWLRDGGVDSVKFIDFGDSRVRDAPDVPDCARAAGMVLAQEFFEVDAEDELRKVRRSLGL